MLSSVRKSLTLPGVSASTMVSVGVVVGFFVLLVKSQIHPAIVFFLQLYLSL